MKLKAFIALIILSVGFSAYGDEFSIPMADIKDFEKIISKKFMSCIVSNSYRNSIYTDIYYCAKREDLENSLPVFSDYPYFTFIFSWYLEKGQTIANAKSERKLISAGLKYYSNGNEEVDNYIVDKTSTYLWKMIDKNTCFHLGNDMGITKRKCNK